MGTEELINWGREETMKLQALKRICGDNFVYFAWSYYLLFLFVCCGPKMATMLFVVEILVSPFTVNDFIFQIRCHFGLEKISTIMEKNFVLGTIDTFS